MTTQMTITETCTFPDGDVVTTDHVLDVSGVSGAHARKLYAYWVASADMFQAPEVWYGGVRPEDSDASVNFRAEDLHRFLVEGV